MKRMFVFLAALGIAGGMVLPAAAEDAYIETGAWTDATWHDGASYTYVEGTDPESVRLTWHGRPEGAVILVR